MAFANFTLLLGGSLIAIPIALHLLMRRQPKRMVFPALQFLKQRRESNRRELQIRHWLLLMLRCAAIGLLAAALARPSVDSATLGRWALAGLLGTVALVAGVSSILAAIQRRGGLLVSLLGAASGLLLLATVFTAGSSLTHRTGLVFGNQRAPVAAVLLFDTSPRMEYRFQNETRLESARDTAQWLIRQLPPESEVGVLTTRHEPAIFSVDLVAAKKAIERLRTTGVAQRLSSVMGRAVQLASSSDKARKEVYVFSDLTSAAWADAPQLAATLKANRDIAIYVIDVGAASPQNVSLAPLQLSAQQVVRNDELLIETELSCVGQAGTYAVELNLEQPHPERPMMVDEKLLLPDARRRDRREIQLADGESRRVELRIQTLEPGTHQGFVSVSTSDALPGDDVRYFSVEVKQAWPVLVVAPDNVVTTFFTEAVAPHQFVVQEQARFDCTVVRQADLPNHNLNDYSVVALLDPKPLTPVDWEQLGSFATEGGSLALFLGHNAQETTSFNHPLATRVVGGRLKLMWRAGSRQVFLAPNRYDHPILSQFRQQASSTPWHWSRVRFHWVLERLEESTAVLARYSNSHPALLETAPGRGRVVTMTTSISDPRHPVGRSSWLELVRGDWPYFMLLNEMLRYLVDGSVDKLNYLAGETAVLSNDPQQDPLRYQLFLPGEQLQDVVAGERDLTVKFTEAAGAYRLKGHRGEPVVRGFAVNLAQHHSQLARLTRDGLNAVMGGERYRYARNRDEIELTVDQARLGREFYPFLVALLALVLGMEYLLANRFYAQREQ